MGMACQIASGPLLEDLAYLQSLRKAISATVDYGILHIESGTDHRPSIPVSLLSQARLDARREVKVETVLRRCLSGYTSIAGFLLEEADHCGVTRAELKAIIDEQSICFDALLVAVSAEYERADGMTRSGSDVRMVQRIRRLLDGEAVNTSEFAYPFDGYHLAVVATGRCVKEQLRHAAENVDRALLTARIGDDDLWGWLGGRRTFSIEDKQVIRSLVQVDGATVGVGEPDRGIEGWRLSHRQARTALHVAENGSRPFARYADVAIVASVQQDALLATSLRKIYLAPFATERDGGAAFRATLRAYIDAGRNISSAAAKLGVSRRTVTKRLRVIESKIGHPIAAALPALDAALRLHELSST
jgi:DNA-binding phage protein